MYVKFLPSEYVIRYKKGKVVQQGVGLSFFYLERSTSACVIPVSNRDADFIFEVLTKDYQTVSVQGQITYAIEDYEAISSAMDFTVDLKYKSYNDDPMPKISKRIVNIVEVLVKDAIGQYNLTEAINSTQELVGSIFKRLKDETEIKSLGLGIVGFSILKISANADTTRALEAETRETILKQADDALYERRNASIEQERKVKENELNTEISVEAKKKTIRETELATKQMVLEKESELERIKKEKELSTKQMVLEKESELERIKIENEILIETKRKEVAQLKLDNSKKETEAKAYRISAIMDAYNRLSPEVLVALSNMNMEPEKMIAQAFQQLASNSDKIGQLNITPDLLESVMKSRTGE